MIFKSTTVKILTANLGNNNASNNTSIQQHNKLNKPITSTVCWRNITPAKESLDGSVKQPLFHNAQLRELAPE